MKIVKVRANGSIPDPVYANSPENDNESFGECPTCGGPTENGEEDVDVSYDEDGCKDVSRSWSWIECSECEAACDGCGETNIEKQNGSSCQDCLDYKEEDE